jgi:glycogen phosphorylase
MPKNPMNGKAIAGSEKLVDAYLRHLTYSLVMDEFTVTRYDQYYAMALAVRDRLIDRWMETQKAHYHANPKRLYYLSLEFLMGRLIDNNIINLGIQDQVLEACKSFGLDYQDIREAGEDAGLGNGGLGRLAACFLDSLATLNYPAIGYGIRYEYGIFRQEIVDGYQQEEPDTWLMRGNPWEIPNPNRSVKVRFGGKIIKPHGESSAEVEWVDTEEILAVPYDIPIVGYQNNCVNSLRLWSARATEDFNLKEFQQGDYFKAVGEKNEAENISKVLYPNDNNYEGKALRFKQQYFFVSASLQDIFRRFKKSNASIKDLSAKTAIQLNDTHPALTILEMMRILLDEEGISWDRAWKMTQETCAYTNHTLLPEALETWSVELFETFLPRHLLILYEINRLFLRDVSLKFRGDSLKLREMSLFQEQPEKHVRMAYLSIVGSHSTNGVAKLHSELLQKGLLSNFAKLYPERFNNKTNGVTPRRWLHQCNPRLSDLISSKIGPNWITELHRLKELEAYQSDSDFLEKFQEIKAENKKTLAKLILEENGIDVNPDSIFDVQVKRMHEYKRQLMNILHLVVLYLRLKNDPSACPVPVTAIFGGKAAPGYFMAKRIIKLITAVAEFVNNDPDTQDSLKIVFLQDYRISLAEKIFPASDLSQQISTAGMEASGTGNMKFALNGALTIGTLDGANVEMAEEIGEENLFIFGLRVEEIREMKASETYSPWDIHDENREIREALDLIVSGFFSPQDKDLFEPIVHSLLQQGDPFFVLADLEAYDRARLEAFELFKHKQEWFKKAVINLANMGKFSSDRSISEYANEIWNLKPIPIP